jgi:RNA recognition motif-containing protein
MGRKLYVGNLANGIDDAKLRAIFASHGEVDSAEVIKDRISGQSKGFGFVEMSSGGDAQTAMTALDGAEHDGRAIKVSEAKSRENRGSGGTRGGRF